jgi:hypothetical protein
MPGLRVAEKGLMTIEKAYIRMMVNKANVAAPIRAQQMRDLIREG